MHGPFELVLQLDAVHDVGLLAHTAAAKVTVRDAGRELDGVLEAVQRQLTQLTADHHVARDGDLRLDPADLLGRDGDAGQGDRRLLHLDLQFGGPAGTHDHSLEHHGPVAQALHAQGPLSRRHRGQDEAAVLRRERPPPERLDGDLGAGDGLRRTRDDDAARDRAGRLRRRLARGHDRCRGHQRGHGRSRRHDRPNAAQAPRDRPWTGAPRSTLHWMPFSVSNAFRRGLPVRTREGAGLCRGRRGQDRGWAATRGAAAGAAASSRYSASYCRAMRSGE